MQPFQFLKKQKILHFEKYLHTMMLKLTEHVGIIISRLYKQKKKKKKKKKERKKKKTMLQTNYPNFLKYFTF